MASRKRTYKTVQVCVSPERHAELKAIADAQGIALSRLAGDLIDEALKNRRKGRAKNADELSTDKIRQALRLLEVLREQD